MSNQFYLQDNRSYLGNDILWWCDGGGYTTDLSKAKVFTKEEAIAQNKDRISDIPWPKEYIDQRTRPAVDMQYCKLHEALKGTDIVLSKPPKRTKPVYRCEDGCGRFVSEEEYYSSVYHGHGCKNCNPQ